MQIQLFNILLNIQLIFIYLESNIQVTVHKLNYFDYMNH